MPVQKTFYAQNILIYMDKKEDVIVLLQKRAIYTDGNLIRRAAKNIHKYKTPKTE
jgi:hypothetical protein